MAQVIDADAILAQSQKPIDADALLSQDAPSQPQGPSIGSQLMEGALGAFPGGVLIQHPGLMAPVGGIVGAALGTVGGPAGIAAGGALGSAAGGAAAKLTHVVKGDEAPQTAGEAAGDLGTDAAWGLLGGASASATLKGAPPLLRAMAHPVGQAIVAGSLTYKATGSIEKALEAAAIASVIGARGRGKALTTMAGKVGGAIEGIAGRVLPRAEQAAVEAPQAITSGMQAAPPMNVPAAAPSANVPVGFRMTVPASAPVPVPASAPAAVKEAVASAPSELEVLKAQVAKEYKDHPDLRDLILKKLDEEAPQAAKVTKVLPDGTRAMPAYHYGVAGKKTPTLPLSNTELAARQRALLGDQPNPFAIGE